MGFNQKWRGWMHDFLISAIASILINGSPMNEFSITKGVRQGDPLSPFCFIISMEGLNVFIISALKKSLVHGINLPHGGLILSHLLYANDAIFVGKWINYNLKI